jgi:hypothetical protein
MNSPVKEIIIIHPNPSPTEILKKVFTLLNIK